MAEKSANHRNVSSKCSEEKIVTNEDNKENCDPNIAPENCDPNITPEINGTLMIVILPKKRSADKDRQKIKKCRRSLRL